MIEKTINTIKGNPKVLLVYGAAVLLMTFGVSAITLLGPGSAEGPVVPDFIFMSSFPGSFWGYLGILMLFALFASTFIWPALGNYIYEMCQGKLEKGWYMRGFRRSWWKVPVLVLILIAIGIAVFMIVGLLVNFLLRSVFIALLINLAMTLTFAVYSVIALTAVFAEDYFAYALGNVFTLGSNYFFKLLGVLLLIYAPGFLGGLLLSYIGMTLNFVIDSFSASYFIMLAFNTIYGVLASVFILTYSMHRYIDERSIYYPTISTEEESRELV